MDIAEFLFENLAPCLVENVSFDRVSVGGCEMVNFDRVSVEET